MNAVRFVQSQTNALWLVLGQATSWTSPNSDSAPPVESKSATGVNSPVCAIVATATWVYEDPVHGTFTFIDANGNPRKFVQLSTVADALANNVTQVLLSASTPASNLAGISLSAFRQSSFVSNLVPASGYTGASFLAAANVTSWGVAETLENDRPQPVVADDTYSMYFIRQF